MMDRQLFAEKLDSLERHLARVEEKLPKASAAFKPLTDEADAVMFHLWLAVQTTLDLAMSMCAQLHLGTPADYGDSFVLLRDAGYLPVALANRLIKAAGFRNAVAHAYARLDMQRVYRAAKDGPKDLRAFFLAMGKAAKLER